MKVLINYSDAKFRKQQRWNTLTGKLFGGFDQVIEYAPDSIDAEFRNTHAEILQTPKGGGLWLWKPYIILQALSKMDDGDYLFYCDSGAIFIKSINKIIQLMESFQQDVLCFHFPLIEKQWTKRDAFILMNCDTAYYLNSPQMIGGYILMKKSPSSISFMEQFLKYSSDKRIISDLPNTLGQENDAEFIVHRHDQSILSLIYKKELLHPGPDPSDYGVFPKQHIHNAQYLYQKELLINSSNQLKGTILSNRSINPIIYYLKYLAKRLISFSRQIFNS